MGWNGRFAALVVLLCGCPSETTFFQCVEDSQCGGEGLCEPGQYCSFPDPECESGRRYGSEAAPGVANQCVPVSETSSSGVAMTGSADATSGADPTTTSSASGTSDPMTSGPGLTSGTTGIGESSTSASVDESSTTASGPCSDMMGQACLSCALTGACKNEAAACSAVPDCNGLFGCLATCRTETCVDGCCAKVSSEGLDAYNAAADCVTLICPDESGEGLICPQ